MKATILDTVTGERMTVDGPRSWEWAENNWSCDCNRANEFDLDAGEDFGFCDGCKRFLVVKAIFDVSDEGDTYTLAELNEGYPPELVARFIPNSANPLALTPT